MVQTKIGIVDNEDEWLKIISQILNQQNDILISWTANNPTEAIRLVNSTKVDFVLLDLNLSDNNFDGIDLAERIVTTNKNIRVIIVTSFNMEELVTKSFLYGAVFFLLKENIEDLPKIIHSLSIKNNPYDVLLKDYRKAKKELILQDLTLTEKELYKLKKEEGLSISQIAFATKKSAGTIRNQLSSAYQKIRNHK